MKPVALFMLLAVAACVSTDPSQPTNMNEESDTATRGVNRFPASECSAQKYFGDSAFAQGLTENMPDTTSPEVMNYASFLRDWYSETFCAVGLRSIYSQRENLDEEAYRFFYEPSFEAPVAVDFIFNKGGLNYTAITWEYELAPMHNADGTTDSALTGTNTRQISSGSLTLDKANEVRMLFDSDLVCQPTDRRHPGIDGTSRIFESLKDGRYCATYEWSLPEDTPLKANEPKILSAVGLIDFYKGE